MPINLTHNPELQKTLDACDAQEKYLLDVLFNDAGSNEENVSNGWIKRSELKPNIKQLASVYNNLVFSENYQKRADLCLKVLTKELCGESNFSEMSKNWNETTEEDKKALLQLIPKRLQTLFSKNGQLFPPKKVYLCAKSQDDESGYVERGNTRKGMTDWSCTITINTSSAADFDDFYTALNTIVHEAFHVVHFALMDSYTLYKDKIDHPLFSDMQMLYHTRYIGGGDLKRILPLYHALPIERDSHSQSKKAVNAIRMTLPQSV